jgi:hypothetical protein
MSTYKYYVEKVNLKKDNNLIKSFSYPYKSALYTYASTPQLNKNDITEEPTESLSKNPPFISSITSFPTIKPFILSTNCPSIIQNNKTIPSNNINSQVNNTNNNNNINSILIIVLPTVSITVLIMLLIFYKFYYLKYKKYNKFKKRDIENELELDFGINYIEDY